MHPINMLSHQLQATPLDHISNILNPWIENAPSIEERREAGERIRSFLRNSYENYLDLSDLNITTLPSRLFEIPAFSERLRTLDLSRNRLTALPSQIGSLAQLSSLHLSGNQLTALPSEIGSLARRLSSLHLSGNQLTALPSEIGSLARLSSLHLSGNQLTALPSEMGSLARLTSLHLSDNQLTALPSEIGSLAQLKELDLSGNWLTALPSQMGSLTQLKKLNLSINLLTALPSEMGSLAQLKKLNLLSNQLTALPTEITQLTNRCRIDLTSCPLPTAVLERLREITSAQGYQGPRFYHSIHEARSAEERPLKALLEELYANANVEISFEEKLEQELEKDPDFKQNLHSWLSRLSWIADYKKGGEQKSNLAKKIVGYLNLSTENPEFLDTFKAILVGAADTCGDRVSLSILDIGIQYDLITCDKTNLPKLAHLISRGIWAMSLLRTAADEKVKSLPFVDEIEVYLGYPIRLKERLNLPLHVEDMLYFACSSLTAQDLNAAADIVEAALNNEDELHAFLMDHPTWLKALELNFPEEFQIIEEAIGKMLDAEDVDWNEIEKEKTRMRLELSKKAL